MGKTKGKRLASYRLKQTKNRRNAKRRARKRHITSSEKSNAAQTVPDPTPSRIATDGNDVGAGSTRRDINSFEGQPGSDDKDRQCAECQRLRTLLYKEQRKPSVFHSECVQCQSRREARIRDAKQSLQYRMFSGESVGSRYLLAALAAKKKVCPTTASYKQV